MNDNEFNSWKEAFSSLPDKQFFNTVRLYLGEIKTPYNKQRLTEQLGSFIRKEENLSNILTLLDVFDLKVLTAISLIPNATQETLADFFHGDTSITEIYAEIINLTERLLIYREKSPYTEKEYFKINPLLKENLIPYLDTTLLFPEYKPEIFSLEDVFALTPNFLTAFITYIRIRGIACKSDGTIKKNDQKHLSEIFPGREKVIQLLMTSFVNLSLVYEDEKANFYDIDILRLKKFSELPELQQYALLCAAAVSRFSKDGLKKEAQLLIDSLATIPSDGCSLETILRLAFLAGTHTEDGTTAVKKSRFSQILAAARQEAGSEPEQNAELLDRMIDCALEFGLLQKIGKTADGVELYKSANNAVAEQSRSNAAHALNENEALPKVLNIDSTFTVTLMPGLPLRKLIPLTDFMIVKKCGVVSEFEITRQSASAGFDNDLSPEDIFTLLENYSNYQLPQNLKINITEWYNSYSSAKLYYGYVLKVRDNNISLAENNPNIRKYIKEKLADGIYLLNLPAGTDISTFIEESSLDFMGNVKTSETKSEYTSFPLLRDGRRPLILESSTKTEAKKTSIAAADKILKALKASLKTLDMEKAQKESLEHRISSRLILSESQLKNASIRTEILEADGMDFAGKVHLIEAAIKEEDMMELQMPTADGKDFFTLVGKPLSISRQPGEAVMRFQIEPTKDIENMLVSRITHLRRLRY